MRVRTFAVGLAVAATAALVAASGVSAVDAKGPPCGDIAMDYFYSGDGTTVSVVLFTPVASCTNVTYTLVVESSPATAPVSAKGDGNAAFQDGGDFVELSTSVADSDNEICISSQTTIGGGAHVIDSAPDTGCIILHPGDTSGGSLPN
jgi:hypothetical protein